MTVLSAPSEFDEALVEPRPLDLTEEDIAAVAWLKSEIEKLSESFPMWSRSALTHRRTEHKVFQCGRLWPEWTAFDPDQKPTWWPNGAMALADLTLNAVKDYRDTVRGEVELVWRIEPEAARSENGLKIYTRLCFETRLTKVANGVWVEGAY